MLRLREQIVSVRSAMPDPDQEIGSMSDTTSPAAAYAWQHRTMHIVTGVAQTDYSGYPDCREKTIKSLQSTLRLGMESDVILHTPLMSLSKKETVLLAFELNAIEAMALTHTCYNGMRPPCGRCPACKLRATGFDEAGIEDPLTQL